MKLVPADRVQSRATREERSTEDGGSRLHGDHSEADDAVVDGVQDDGRE